MFSTFLKKLSPLHLEQEILSMSRDVPLGAEADFEDDTHRMKTLLEFLEDIMNAKEDFEFSQVIFPHSSFKEILCFRFF